MARALAPPNPSAFKVSMAAPIKASRVSFAPPASRLPSWLFAPDFATWPPSLSDRFEHLLNSCSLPAWCQIPLGGAVRPGRRRSGPPSPGAPRRLTAELRAAGFSDVRFPNGEPVAHRGRGAKRHPPKETGGPAPGDRAHLTD